jgi:hypothetical protein
MATKIQWKSAAVQEYLDGQHGVEQMLRERAERGAANMRANAPVLTGNYRDAIDVWEDHTDRLVVRYGSRSPHAHLVEARDGIAARSIDAVGGS